MGAASEGLFALKPVNFRYKRDFDADRSERFGLIAEDVEKVNPTLVAHDDKGNLTTVRYEAVNAMLLNEFLKEHDRFLEEQSKVQKLEAALAAVNARLKEHDAKIEKVSAQIELNNSAPQIAGNQR